MSKPDLFDRQFRRTARGMRRPPGPRTWDRIAPRLDHREGRGRILGMRPWLIAAMVLIVAGVAALTQLPTRNSYDPLAQRAESVEELTDWEVTRVRFPDYDPLTEGTGSDRLVSPAESREPQAQLAPAPKYRL